MEFVKGPDFPTGALILGRAGIIDAYRTGRGSIRVRARAEIDEDQDAACRSSSPNCRTNRAWPRSPRGSPTSSNARELDGIRSVDDLSAGDDTKLVIGLKRDANANVVLNNLFKQTGLQTSFGVNMVALVDGVPRTLNLRAGVAGLHRPPGRSHHPPFAVPPRARQARAHIVEGLIKALDKIDAIIELIRASEDRGAAREGLMAKPFEFSEIQANHILDMRLVMLTRLNGCRAQGRDEEASAHEIAELE